MKQDETSILCCPVSREDEVFLYKLVSNYLMSLKACHAGFQACAECNLSLSPFTLIIHAWEREGRG